MHFVCLLLMSAAIKLVLSKHINHLYMKLLHQKILASVLVLKAPDECYVQGCNQPFMVHLCSVM